ncbi:hypothetical protein ACMV_31480 [Acidiphilium multivorum AIU301]|uniref:Uncharacterized protein n=1 Tax=Acidiphilium multivorum (strain DSM 11245 / JCM 8867 / NBRC 100883 / AIU 301) TaxID=926570 RepID=F0J5V1_ACIMA|nr:hypothetical protein ACMV_31480 [Acidiphilium multivorum AIU301]GAN74056.1 hypothetical protein Apmu_0133_07 [Acidiphilium multivorum AIU301]
MVLDVPRKLRRQLGKSRFAASLKTHDLAVNFHSLRHWFITKARRNADQAVVARIVGHAQQTITDHVYNHGPGDDVERRCVEAVRLPE